MFLVTRNLRFLLFYDRQRPQSLPQRQPWLRSIKLLRSLRLFFWMRDCVSYVHPLFIIPNSIPLFLISPIYCSIALFPCFDDNIEILCVTPLIFVRILCIHILPIYLLSLVWITIFHPSGVRI